MDYGDLIWEEESTVIAMPFYYVIIFLVFIGLLAFLSSRYWLGDSTATLAFGVPVFLALFFAFFMYFGLRKDRKIRVKLYEKGVQIEGKKIFGNKFIEWNKVKKIELKKNLGLVGSNIGHMIENVNSLLHKQDFIYVNVILNNSSFPAYPTTFFVIKDIDGFTKALAVIKKDFSII